MTITIKNADNAVLRILNGLKSFKSDLKIIKEPEILSYNESKNELEKLLKECENGEFYTMDEVKNITNKQLKNLGVK